MKISVIIPTYKPQAYLWECLDSLVYQTFPKEDFEVILVLNGCTEPWKSQIQEYIDTKMQGMNVNFIHTEQGGVSNARNMALDVAEGEYITFIDDDDYVSPEFIEELYVRTTHYRTAISNTIAFEDRTGKIFEDYVISKDFEKCKRKTKVSVVKARRYFAGPVRKLIAMEIIGDRKFDVSFKNGEDTLFMFLISDKIKEVTCMSNSAIYYRRIRESSASMRKRSFLNRSVNSFRLILEYSKIYFSSPLRYNGIFYIMNVLGSIKTIFRG